MRGHPFNTKSFAEVGLRTFGCMGVGSTLRVIDKKLERSNDFGNEIGFGDIVDY